MLLSYWSMTKYYHQSPPSLIHYLPLNNCQHNVAETEALNYLLAHSL